MKAHVFMGAVWGIMRVSKLRRKLLGLCDPETKTLYIPIEGDTYDELYAIVHEAIHACFDFMSEEWVEAAAASIATLLWRLGWRKQDE